MAFFELDKVTISFGGLVALNQVNFAIEKGDIFSIIGPNGAGKTTIFNCINRYYNLDKGRIMLEDRDLTKVAPHTVADLGVARTFQNIELFKNATVIDNLLLGRHRRRSTSLLSEFFFTGKARRQEMHAREKAEEVIDFLDLQAYRDQQVTNLPYGVQKTVELGRALSMEPQLLLLDEPSSGLNMEETQDLLYWIQDIKEELGITIVIVEHNMKLVNEISDKVLALNFGQILTLGTPQEVLEHPEVQKAYLGDDGAAA